jgi:hypothetical protein
MVGVNYILGVYDALASNGVICMPTGPGGVTQGQMADVVKLYLRSHPEFRHLSADELVAAALKEKFPCN